MDDQKQICQCDDCGKKFEKGTEGDNECVCLRCEREAIISTMNDSEYENFDRMESRND